LLGFQTRPTAAIDRIFAAAELADFVVHDLRHSFASEALSNGYTLDQIGQLLGHTDVQTTRRYAHLVRATKHAAAEDIAIRLSERLRAATYDAPSHRAEDQQGHPNVRGEGDAGPQDLTIVRPSGPNVVLPSDRRRATQR
jgi:hypothetical protein